jgi:hypothetical protein
MATTASQAEPPRALSHAEAQAFFDAQVDALLGISGEELLRRLDAGEYANIPDDAKHADILYLATLQSIGRRHP